MALHKDLDELINAKVISSETAERISNYYEEKGKSSGNRLFTVFGILGAILIGLGIILILAHNWDQLSKTVKTFFGFLPLIIGQILCGYTLLKKKDSSARKESSAAFLFFAVGASIGLISQIYNIPGNLSSFILTWMLLCLPLVYLMPSSIVSLMYICGITYYACETNYWGRYQTESSVYWLLLLGVFPHYYLLYKNKPQSNFMTFHNWLIPLSLTICMGIVSRENPQWLFVIYINLFAIFYLIGETDFFKKRSIFSNGYRVLGSLGTVIVLLILSFSWFWEDLRTHYELGEMVNSLEFFIAIGLTILAGVLHYFYWKNKGLEDIQAIAPIFLLFLIIFLTGFFSPVSVFFINIFVFILGVLTINKGIKQNHLGILNYGLLIIMALVLCRFFDEELSFILRGIMFVAVGVGFFVTNYWMLKKRREGLGNDVMM